MTHTSHTHTLLCTHPEVLFPVWSVWEGPACVLLHTHVPVSIVYECVCVTLSVVLLLLLFSFPLMRFFFLLFFFFWTETLVKKLQMEKTCFSLISHRGLFTWIQRHTQLHTHNRHTDTDTPPLCAVAVNWRLVDNKGFVSNNHLQTFCSYKAAGPVLMKAVFCM